MIHRRLFGLYLLVGGIFSILVLVYVFGSVGWLIHPIPLFICYLFVFYFIAAGAYSLIKPSNATSEKLIFISLLIQSLQIEAFGWKFKNYFGPYAAIKISGQPRFSVEWVAKILDFRYGNGFDPNRDEFFICLNLVPLLLIVLLDYLEGASSSIQEEQ